MTIKEATKKMLWEIHLSTANKENGYKTAKDQQIALILGLTQATYSRLKTGVTTPQIMTWAKICRLHAQCRGQEETNKIINQIECA